MIKLKNPLHPHFSESLTKLASEISTMDNPVEIVNELKKGTNVGDVLAIEELNTELHNNGFYDIDHFVTVVLSLTPEELNEEIYPNAS